MPRLLPRLLKWLEHNPPSQPDFRGPLAKRRRKIRSLWKPIPSPDELNKSFILNNRHESLLLEGDEVIVKQNALTRHKSLPPMVKLQKNQEDQTIGRDIPREMSELEKQWWSSPYLRMLSSPIRSCILSSRHLPTDFLIRLTAVRMPRKNATARITTMLVPNGILHPRFASRQQRVVYYVTCWKEALKETLSRGDYKKPIININVHRLLLDQISSQLRQRVLQELEMLALRLKAAPRTLCEDVVIRRLTRSEWTTMKTTGHVPWEGAVCVLIVPPVNKDPVTKERPQPNYEDVPPEVSEYNVETARPLPPLPPLSTLCPVQEPSYEDPLEFFQDIHLPHSRVPVYNGLTLFPSRPQRSALHKKLCEVLVIENRVRWKQKTLSDEGLRNEKPSHAFIVFSSKKTIARADSVPLAIALWRIRMWEGTGWGDCDWLTHRSPGNDPALK
ncbi:hypothetical protein ACEPAG_6447 [Sanghuangporus baumii]